MSEQNKDRENSMMYIFHSQVYSQGCWKLAGKFKARDKDNKGKRESGFRKGESW